MNYTETYMAETSRAALAVDQKEVEQLAAELYSLRDRARMLYVVGLGGSAANADHAAADFRKLCWINAISIAALVPELTAWANDEGWQKAFNGALGFARPGDALFVLSVGGGAQGVSLPLIEAVDTAKTLGMRVFGIVGRDGGYVKSRGDAVVLIPTVATQRITPHTEGLQLVVIHCLVSHPILQRGATKW